MEGRAKRARLPRVEAGEVLSVLDILHEQKFTQPPPRYSEATLVRALEERGIGRPSTYAQDILSKIQDREYVAKKERKFVPTEIGTVVSELLVSHFEDHLRLRLHGSSRGGARQHRKGGSGLGRRPCAPSISDFSRELAEASEEHEEPEEGGDSGWNRLRQVWLSHGCEVGAFRSFHRLQQLPGV